MITAIAIGAVVLLVLSYLILLDSSYHQAGARALRNFIGIPPYALQLLLGVLMGNINPWRPSYHPRHLVA